VSRYHLNRLLYDLKMDEALCREAEADLDRVMARYALSEAERAALVAGTRGRSVSSAPTGCSRSTSCASTRGTARTSTGPRSEREPSEG
jgi:hypothetical protein